MTQAIKGFLFGLVFMINLLAIASGWFVLRVVEHGQSVQFIKSGCGIDSLLNANVRE